MNDSDFSGTFWEHVAELRQTLLRAILVIAIGVGAALCFYPSLYRLLTLPLQKIHEIPSGHAHLKKQDLKQERLFNPGPRSAIYKAQEERLIRSSSGVMQESGVYIIPAGEYIDIEKTISSEKLMVFGPVEGMSATLKMCFWIGLTGTSPIWLFLILKFILPALNAVQRRIVFPFLMLSLALFSAGVLFAFFVTIPLANRYLELFNQTIGINLWSLANYLDYTGILLLASGLAFEMGVILFFLVHYGVISADGMAAKRRHMIVAAFILGAILTPPDIFTQFLLAIPMIGLYELAILYARVRLRNKQIIVPEHG